MVPPVTIDPYGLESEPLASYMDTISETSIDVSFIEAFSTSHTEEHVAFEQSRFTNFEDLKQHLSKEVEPLQCLRIMSVSKLSKPLLQLLGHSYNMDHELWTCRFPSSDREWFAGPLMDRGAQKFSFFNLSFVDFKKATSRTPDGLKKSVKLNHTTRLVRLFDVGSSDTSNTVPIYVIRRISCYIRLDGSLWTIIFLNDPHVSLNKAYYEAKIPGEVQLPVESWLVSLISNITSHQSLAYDLSRDGFGFIVRLLREIKTSWKLFLNELEVFLEQVLEELNDDELIESANWLHRTFLLNIDYVERQLLYHNRYITYITSFPSQPDIAICPNIFQQDMLQEKDALQVVDQSLRALRTRTTSVLKIVLSLVAIKQSRTSSNIAELQWKDAQLTFSQGQSIRRLTIVNMVYLPATFIATVYGMQIVENGDEKPWTLWSFTILSLALTIITLFFASYKIEKLTQAKCDSEVKQDRESDNAENGVPWWNRVPWLLNNLRLVRIRVEQKPLDTQLV